MITFDIAMISDDNYVMPTMVTIRSLFKNINLDLLDRCVVHVCTFGINEKNQNRLLSLKSDKCTIDIKTVDEAKYSARLSAINCKTHVTQVALLKFDFAASYELWKKFTDHGNEEFYFNSGVMYLNLKKMREDHISKTLWDTKLKLSSENSGKFVMMDQDALNIVCGQKCKPLSILYNFNCHFYNNQYINAINDTYDLHYRDKEQLLSDVVVIHYVGKHDKPWKYENAKLVGYWDRYYLLCGGLLEELAREKFRKTFKDRVLNLNRYVKNNGLKALIKYVLKK